MAVCIAHFVTWAQRYRWTPDIAHVPGVKYVWADGLSRSHQSTMSQLAPQQRFSIDLVELWNPLGTDTGPATDWPKECQALFPALNARSKKKRSVSPTFGKILTRRPEVALLGGSAARCASLPLAAGRSLCVGVRRPGRPGRAPSLPRGGNGIRPPPVVQKQEVVMCSATHVHRALLPHPPTITTSIYYGLGGMVCAQAL